MRNPNGYGGISYLGKGRRNPYRVRITTGWEYDEKTGKHKQLYATLGYYPSRKEAMMALAAYNTNPYDLDAEKITFAEAYEAWSSKDYLERGYSSKMQMIAAYKKCEPLYKMRMKDIKKNPMQDILDKYADQSETSQQNIKTLLRNVFKFCMENDLISKDYTSFLSIKTKGESDIHAPYTAEEITLLWDNLKTPVALRHSRHDFRDIFPADAILILIYTGMRPGELLKMECKDVHLDEKYMVGGSKTAAGKNRIVPIHEDIVPLVAARMKAGNKFLIPYKTDAAPKLDQFRLYMHDPLLKKIGISHLPHDGRHTFSTFAKRYKVDELSRKLIMGHKIQDITDGVYTHKTVEELVAEVNKIIFVEK